ncbi:hypothetical protein ABZT02_44925 [Streptomyces sp. NPDC005402]|uniref:hypothetical protein n=1 Tax=Streptomyces sp. NPDC005402 TaxID=3155338 RepID=UPI0033BB4E8C
MPLPPLDRVRAVVGHTRDAAGRVGAVGGAAVLAASLVVPEAAAAALPAAGIVAGGGYLVSMAPAGEAAPGWLRTMYAAPAVTCVAEAIAFQFAPGIRWWEVLAAAGWTALTWWLRPSKQAREWATEAAGTEAAAAVYEHIGDAVAVQGGPAVQLTGALEERLASWWAAHASVEGGPAPGTHLERIAAIGPKEFAAWIVADVPGQPVPAVSVPRLSALMDIEEELFAVGPVKGRGAGYRRLRVGAVAAGGPEDFAELWAQKIAPTAMPGTTVVAVRAGHIDKEDQDQ